MKKPRPSVQIMHHAGVAVPDYPRIQKVLRRLGDLRPGKHLDVVYAEESLADYHSKRGWDCLGLVLTL